MAALQAAMSEYHERLEQGTIQQAYRGLMQFMMDLRTRLQNRHPDCAVSGLYQGFMDMTYFALVPESLKRRGLKVAIVFLHEAFRFEVWLAAANKGIQQEYWNLLRARGWDRYPLVSTIKGHDAIIEHALVEDPEFDDPEALAERLETGTLAFVADIERFLSAQDKTI